MDDLVRKFDVVVIQCIKDIEFFECFICYDGVEDLVLVIFCGYDICLECFILLIDNVVRNNVFIGNENVGVKCL